MNLKSYAGKSFYKMMCYFNKIIMFNNTGKPFDGSYSNYRKFVIQNFK